MNAVKVIEALCGCGKSYWAIDMMSNNQKDQWMFITPFLDEAGECGSKDSLGNYGTPSKSKPCRVNDQAPDMNFKCPSDSMRIEVKVDETLIQAIVRTSKLKDKRLSNIDEESEIVKLTKSEHLYLLLLEGANVSLTHALFLKVKKEIVDIIKENNIRIVIDETIEKVDIFSSSKTLINDVRTLIDLSVICVSNNGRLDWIGNYLSHYNEIYDMCEDEILYLYKDLLLVRRYSSFAYEAAKDVFILTYMFKDSPMRVWMDACDIPWSYHYPDLKTSTKAKKQQIRGLINIEKYDNSIEKHEIPNARLLSSNWFKRTSKNNPNAFKDIRKLANKLYARWYSRKGEAPKVMYTTFLKYAEDVSGKGTKRVDYKEPSLVSKNARASNKHDDRDSLLYWVDVYPHMSLQLYLDSIVLL